MTDIDPDRRLSNEQRLALLDLLDAYTTGRKVTKWAFRACVGLGAIALALVQLWTLFAQVRANNH